MNASAILDKTKRPSSTLLLTDITAMKTSMFSGFPVVTDFARFLFGAAIACFVLSCAIPAIAADAATEKGAPTTTVHKLNEAPPVVDNPVTVSPGTGTFQGLIPPAGSAVANPPHAADKSTAPSPTPTATVRYGAAKPDGEDTHPPLNLSADRAELVRLDTEASSVIVGNPETVNIQMENRKLLVLTPAKAGATYLSVLDDAGNVVMQRHIIVSSPKNNYIRIRRSCNGSAKNCQQTSVYYCPGMCHAVGGENSSNNGGTAASSGAGEGAAAETTPPTTGAEPTAPATTAAPASAPPVNPTY
ncbi:MAG: hypothetical protein JWO78_248 [Micavibrio sp.]|nr:hypothetical protein [Micavibrio sp.]